MKRNLVWVGLIAIVLCVSVAFLTGCAKKAALKEGAGVAGAAQDQKAVSAGTTAAQDDAAARERATRRAHFRALPE